MGDWDFLYEMRERGCSPKEVEDAATCGYDPWETICLDGDWVDDELDDADRGSGETDNLHTRREGFPRSFIEQTQILEDLVDCAMRHYENTGRYLQIWGELGEIYAEVRFGLRRHCTHHAGSDGTIDGAEVEVKTISPEKGNDRVTVKVQGGFEKLLIVKIDEGFNFKAKLFDRSDLARAGSKHLKRNF